MQEYVLLHSLRQKERNQIVESKIKISKQRH